MSCANFDMQCIFQGVSVLDFPGGLPTSLNYSGEQWDFPNAWPPLVVSCSLHNINTIGS